MKIYANENQLKVYMQGLQPHEGGFHLCSNCCKGNMSVKKMTHTPTSTLTPPAPPVQPLNPWTSLTSEAHSDLLLVSRTCTQTLVSGTNQLIT